MQFLVVEVQGAESPMLRLLRSLPGVRMDVFLLAPLPRQTTAVRAVCQVEGGAASDRQRVVDAFRAMDPALEGMPSPAQAARLNLGIPAQAMSREMKALLAFATKAGLHSLWSRVEEGVAFVRLLVPGDASDLAEALRDHLRRSGADAQVALEEADEGDAVGRIHEMTAMLERLRSKPDARRRAEGF